MGRKKRQLGVPDAWQFVEGEVPGCYAAWVRDVNEDTPSTLGVSGDRKRGTFGVTAWKPGSRQYWRLLATDMRWVRKEAA